MIRRSLVALGVFAAAVGCSSGEGGSATTGGTGGTANAPATGGSGGGGMAAAPLAYKP